MFWCLSTDIYHGKPLTNNVKANKVLRRIKQNPLVIRFPNHGEVDQLQLQCYSDASLANLSSRNSAEGHVIFLVEQNSNVCPLSSRTNTLRCVARSTLSAETSDMSNALEITYFLPNVLSEILFLKMNFIKCQIIEYQYLYLLIVNFYIEQYIQLSWLMNIDCKYVLHR